jgi:hypothetical protein
MSPTRRANAAPDRITWESDAANGDRFAVAASLRFARPAAGKEAIC